MAARRRIAESRRYDDVRRLRCGCVPVAGDLGHGAGHLDHRDDARGCAGTRRQLALPRIARRPDREARRSDARFSHRTSRRAQCFGAGHRARYAGRRRAGGGTEDRLRRRRRRRSRGITGQRSGRVCVPSRHQAPRVGRGGRRRRHARRRALARDRRGPDAHRRSRRADRPRPSPLRRPGAALLTMERRRRFK